MAAASAPAIDMNATESAGEDSAVLLLLSSAELELLDQLRQQEESTEMTTYSYGVHDRRLWMAGQVPSTQCHNPATTRQHQRPIVPFVFLSPLNATQAVREDSREPLPTPVARRSTVPRGTLAAPLGVWGRPRLALATGVVHSAGDSCPTSTAHGGGRHGQRRATWLAWTGTWLASGARGR